MGTVLKTKKMHNAKRFEQDKKPMMWGGGGGLNPQFFKKKIKC
jgi:hypothetical protein